MPFVPDTQQTAGRFVPDDQAQPEMSLLERVGETITGTRRTTAETTALPDWATMPELNSFSMASAKTGLGTLMANPGETVKIIQANFPGVQARQDEKGNFLLRSSIDGKEYAIKPGFAVSDIPRALGGIAAFTPAGRATTLLGTGTAAATTQAVIEGSQAATGGEFNPGDVALAGGVGVAVPGAARVIGAAAQPLKAALSNTSVGRAIGMKSQAQAAPAAAVPAAAEPAAMPVNDLAQTARVASTGGFGSKSATQRLAAEAAPDAETVAAAERLGIKEYLQPDHYTTNQAYRQLAQLVKSQTGSPAATAQHEGLVKVAEKADELVTSMGGTNDLSALSEGLREQMHGAVDKLKSAATANYDKVATAIPPKTPAPATDLLAFIKTRAENLGGPENLSSTEKTLLAKLAPKKDGSLPTYALVDDVRKGLNAVKYGKGEPAFQGADDKLLNDLIGSLRGDQARAAEAAGQGEAWELAQSLSRQYKAVQDDMASLFGAHLDSSLARGGQSGLPGSVRVLAKGDADRLSALIRAVPPDMRQQVAASGLSSFFQRTSRGGEMDFAGYANWFEGLQRNQRAYAALMSNLPNHSVRQLNDLAKVARGVAASKGEFIATGKALNPKALEAAETLTGRLFDEVRRRGISGLVAEGAGSASGAPGLATALQSALQRGQKPSAVQAVDRLITSPEFLEAVNKAGTSQARSAVSRLAYSKDFNKLMRALGQPRELKDRERWILQALEAQNETQRPSGATVH